MSAGGFDKLAVLPGKVDRTLGLLWEIMRAVCHGAAGKVAMGTTPGRAEWARARHLWAAETSAFNSIASALIGG